MPDTIPDNSIACDLYWIAFLITGCAERSTDLTIRVLEAENGPEGLDHPATFARLRRAVIGKVLAESCGQFIPAPTPAVVTVVDSGMNMDHVRDAVLGISLFSRCALLLTVFEGIALKEAAALLATDEQTVSEGRIDGLLQLTRNLASGRSYSL
jgi:hypothetical protein